ncbi:MAG: exonuclease SbcCD subunit D [Promethearchaeota archaeon]
MTIACNGEAISNKVTNTSIPSTNTVKFIHASDIHLGAAQYNNEYRSYDFIRAFQEILELASDHNIDFIILSGDVFTSLEMLPGNLTKIINILTEFKIATKENIPIIAIEGNHDIRKFSRGVKFPNSGQSWLKLLSNLDLVVLLDGDLNAIPTEIYKSYDSKLKTGGKIRIKNIVIYGNRYIGQAPREFLPKIYKAIDKESGFFTILLQHFGIEGQMENVPGIALGEIIPLKDKVDYLALGHFHKQYIINNWIYNPGSSEAASPIDASFKRGIFLVEIRGTKKFTKNVRIIQLKNRKHRWETIFFQEYIRTKQDLYNFILLKLKPLFKYTNETLKSSDVEMPVLNLVFKGKKPLKLKKVNVREISEMIYNNLPVVDVKIYQMFNNSLTTLDRYI